MASTRSIKAVIKAEDRASPVINRLSGTIKALGAVAVAAGVVQLGRKLVQGLQAATAAAAEEELADRKLATALQITGQYSKELFKDLTEQAGALQAVTDVGNETIQQMQALFLQFKVAPEYVTRLTESTLDLSKSMKIDYLSAAGLVAKALSGNIGALSRYGISLDSAKVKTEGAAYVIEQLNAKFGGSARAEADTYAGSVRQVANQFGDLQEVIGGPFTEVLKAVNQEVMLPFLSNLTSSAEKADFARKAVLRLAAGIAELAAVAAEFGSNKLVATALTLLTAKAVTALHQIQLLTGAIGNSGERTNFASIRLQALADRLTALSNTELPEATSGVKGLGAALEGIGGSSAEPEIKIPSIEGFGSDLDDRLGALRERLAAFRADVTEAHNAASAAAAVNLQNTLELQDMEIQATQEHTETWLELQLARLATAEAAELASAEKTGASKALIVKKYDRLELEMAKRNALAKAQLVQQVGTQAVSALTAVFGQNKALAYAQAIIDTYAGAVTAWKAYSYNPPLAAAMAGLVIAAGLANVAKIASTNPQKFAGGGFVPFVPGAVANRDSVPALLTPGELVLNQQQQAALAGGGQAIVLEIEMGPNLQALADELSVNVRQGHIHLAASETVTTRRVR